MRLIGLLNPFVTPKWQRVVVVVEHRLLIVPLLQALDVVVLQLLHEAHKFFLSTLEERLFMILILLFLRRAEAGGQLPQDLIGHEILQHARINYRRQLLLLDHALRAHLVIVRVLHYLRLEFNFLLFDIGAQVRIYLNLVFFIEGTGVWRRRVSCLLRDLAFLWDLVLFIHVDV